MKITKIILETLAKKHKLDHLESEDGNYGCLCIKHSAAPPVIRCYYPFDRILILTEKERYRGIDIYEPTIIEIIEQAIKTHKAKNKFSWYFR